MYSVISNGQYKNTNQLRHEKTNILVSNLVRHKPGCTATEDGYRLDISDFESRGIVLCSENKDADQLHGYREADLRLYFRICKMLVFSQRGSNCWSLLEANSKNTNHSQATDSP